jgi:hypothetical protein
MTIGTKKYSHMKTAIFKKNCQLLTMIDVLETIDLSCNRMNICRAVKFDSSSRISLRNGNSDTAKIDTKNGDTNQFIHPKNPTCLPSKLTSLTCNTTLATSNINHDKNRMTAIKAIPRRVMNRQTKSLKRAFISVM